MTRAPSASGSLLAKLFLLAAGFLLLLAAIVHSILPSTRPKQSYAELASSVLIDLPARGLDQSSSLGPLATLPYLSPGFLRIFPASSRFQPLDLAMKPPVDYPALLHHAPANPLLEPIRNKLVLLIGDSLDRYAVDQTCKLFQTPWACLDLHRRGDLRGIPGQEIADDCWAEVRKSWLFSHPSAPLVTKNYSNMASFCFQFP